MAARTQKECFDSNAIFGVSRGQIFCSVACSGRGRGMTDIVVADTPASAWGLGSPSVAGPTGVWSDIEA